uniref:Uncharacterized protein n=1 Tax=Ditylenchus dipsaci TaxID=166011 RepID=A0A915EN53_9BILA
MKDKNCDPSGLKKARTESELLSSVLDIRTSAAKISFHCFCHVLHLVVWDGIDKTSIVAAVVDKAKKNGIGFHHTPSSLAAFRELQGSKSTTLKLENKTRWNSTLEMFGSVLHHSDRAVSGPDRLASRPARATEETAN